jgi:hypothetical protein
MSALLIVAMRITYVAVLAMKSVRFIELKGVATQTAFLFDWQNAWFCNLLLLGRLLFTTA